MKNHGKNFQQFGQFLKNIGINFLLLCIIITVISDCDNFVFYDLADDINTNNDDAPAITITSTESPGPTESNPIPIIITFDKEVSGFTLTDITIGNGLASDFYTDNNIVFTANIIPLESDVIITVDIAAGVCQDNDNNDNSAAPQFVIYYQDSPEPTPEGPEMNVHEGGADIPDGTEDYFIGAIDSGNSTDITFTIENSGSGDLTLTGTPRVTITGSWYSLNTDASSTVTPGGSTTFIVTFAPSTPGMNTGTISIANNDANGNPYNFTIRGASLTTEILAVIDGYSSLDENTLEEMGNTYIVQTSDDDWWIVNKGDWTSYEFSQPSSAPLYIDSVVIYCEHYEEKNFDNGNLVWQVGSGWQTTPSVWATTNPAVTIDESDTTDTWDVTIHITTSNINNTEFCIENLDSGKSTNEDYIYIEIKYAP